MDDAFNLIILCSYLDTEVNVSAKSGKAKSLSILPKNFLNPFLN